MVHKEINKSSETNAGHTSRPAASPRIDPSLALLDFMELLARLLAERWMTEAGRSDSGAVPVSTHGSDEDP
jgi:hypothetical protein